MSRRGRLCVHPDGQRGGLPRPRGDRLGAEISHAGLVSGPMYLYFAEDGAVSSERARSERVFGAYKKLGKRRVKRIKRVKRFKRPKSIRVTRCPRAG